MVYSPRFSSERIACWVSCWTAIQGGSDKDSQKLDIVLDENQTWNSYWALAILLSSIFWGFMLSGQAVSIWIPSPGPGQASEHLGSTFIVGFDKRLKPPNILDD